MLDSAHDSVFNRALQKIVICSNFATIQCYIALLYRYLSKLCTCVLRNSSGSVEFRGAIAPLYPLFDNTGT